MNARRVRGLLAVPLVAVLVATTAAHAVGASTTRRGATRHLSTVAGRLQSASDNIGLAAHLRDLLHPKSRQATLRELSSPALRANVATALAGETPCGQTPGLLCSQVDVPLDRSGLVPGTISLHLERLPALGTPKGVMFLIAGGPGQGSARSFDLGSPNSAALFRVVFPGYTLVAYDDRGTGASGLLRCPALENARTNVAETVAVGSCADSLGISRTFYSTLDHAADLEAVRASLGVDKVGLYGVSYGTKLALAYALGFPTHVERLLLDSVVPTNLPDPLNTNVLKAMPTTLANFCTGGTCQAATGDLSGDAVALANQLEAKPVTGKVLQPNGSSRMERASGDELISLIIDSDLNPGLAAVMPAAIHEARGGDPKALLRLVEYDKAGAAEAPQNLSSALNAATNCHDGPFPWQPDTAVADRPALLTAAIAALPAGALGPFGSWAARLGTAQFCLTWPAPSGGVTYGTTVPNVPVLAISGGYDMRTPTASATAVAAIFPQGRVLVVPGVGHSVVGTDPSLCSIDSVRAWLSGGAVPSQCPRGNPYLNTTPGFAAVRSTARVKSQNAQRTFVLAAKTIREAEGIWLMTNGGVAGVYSGKLVATAPTAFKLVRYSVAPGVELSGTIRFVKFGPPLQFDGTITVSGARGAHGLLGISGDKVGGTLDGQLVGR